jgi:hypothetical protein
MESEEFMLPSDEIPSSSDPDRRKPCSRSKENRMTDRLVPAKAFRLALRLQADPW